jgi:hypothetical protein
LLLGIQTGQQFGYPQFACSFAFLTVWQVCHLYFLVCGASFCGISGARFFTQINIFLFVGQMAAAALGIISFLIPHDYTDPNNNGTARYVNFPAYFTQNLYANYTTAEQFPESSQNPSPCFGTGDGNCNYNAVFAIICMSNPFKSSFSSSSFTTTASSSSSPCQTPLLLLHFCSAFFAS